MDTIGAPIHSGTIATDVTPYATRLYGSKQQFVYRAAELQAAGVPTNRPIQSVAFEVVPDQNFELFGGLPAVEYPNFKITLALTDSSNVRGSFLEMPDQAHFRQDFTPAKGWNEHPLNRPFFWDGSSNLVVETCVDGDGTVQMKRPLHKFAFFPDSFPYNTPVRLDTSQPLNSWATAFGNMPCGDTVPPAIRRDSIITTWRPIIRLNIDDQAQAPSCAPLLHPQDGAKLHPIVDRTLRWEHRGPQGDWPSYYHVYFGPNPDPPKITDSNEVKAPEFQIPFELAPNTTYFWKVEPANQAADAPSDGPCTTFSFTTAPADDPGGLLNSDLGDSAFLSRYLEQGIINRYAKVTEVQQQSLTLDTGARGFSAGDRVVIIQMQGADISTADNPDFGKIRDYRSAGNFEFNFLEAQTGPHSFTLKAPLQKTYDPAGQVQLVKVPLLRNPTLYRDVRALPWNEERGTGGIVVLEALDTLAFAPGSDVIASRRGFRATLGNTSTAWRCNPSPVDTLYRFTANQSEFAGNKGEGIAQSQSAYRKGRGPMGNGGGGGNGMRGGGGGGGNGTGGGLGGHGEQCDSSQGDLSVQQGLGGHPIDYQNQARGRLFMGGAGGTGDGSQTYGVGRGGHGGGIILLKASVIEARGNNKFLAEGQKGINSGFGFWPIGGQNCSANGEGAGGGGAGGTLFLAADAILGCPEISIRGGDGGNTIRNDDTSNFDWGGPAGGGGAGAILTTNASLPTCATTELTPGNGGSATLGVLTLADCFLNHVHFVDSVVADQGTEGSQPGEGGFPVFGGNEVTDPIVVKDRPDTVFTYHFTDSLGEANAQGLPLNAHDSGQFENSQCQAISYQMSDTAGLVFDNADNGFFIDEAHALHLTLRLEDLQTWNKIIDWHGRADTEGLYLRRDSLWLAPYEPVAVSVPEGTFFDLFLVQHGSDSGHRFQAFLNGQKVLDRPDPSLASQLSLNNRLSFFLGDTLQPERGAVGSLCQLRVFNYAPPESRSLLADGQPPDFSVDIGADTSLCSGGVNFTTGLDTAFFVHNWSNGDLGNTAFFSAQTDTVWVSVRPRDCFCTEKRDTALIQTPDLGVHLPEDTFLCQGDSLLLGNSNTDAFPKAEFLWSTGSSDSTLRVDSSGLYWLELSYQNCPPQRDSIRVESLAKPLLAAGPDSVCPGTRLNALPQDSSVSLLWQREEQTMTRDSSSILAEASGTYRLVAEKSGCQVISRPVEVVAIPDWQLPEDTLVCAQSVELSPVDSLPAGFQLTWEDGSHALTRNFTKSDSHRVVLSSPGCGQRVFQFRLALRPPPKLMTPGGQCQQEFVTVDSLDPSGVYRWMVNGEATPSRFGFDSIQATDTGRYWLEGETSECAVISDTVRIVPKPLLLAEDTTVCTNDTFRLTSGSANRFTSLHWSPGKHFVDSTVLAPTLRVGSQDLQLVLTVFNETCVQRDTMKVDVPELKADFRFSPNRGNLGTTVEFTNRSEGGVTFLWEFGDGSTSIQENPAHRYTRAGKYRPVLHVFSLAECEEIKVASDTINIFSRIRVPSAITPNGDGVNDKLELTPLPAVGLPGSKLTIFNQWGDIVFEAENYDNTWDGGNLPAGIYYYKFNPATGNPPKKGSLLIMR